MTDTDARLIERLRMIATPLKGDTARTAADRIESLTAEVARLREVLQTARNQVVAMAIGPAMPADAAVHAVGYIDAALGDSK